MSSLSSDPLFMSMRKDVKQIKRLLRAIEDCTCRGSGGGPIPGEDPVVFCTNTFNTYRDDTDLFTPYSTLRIDDKLIVGGDENGQMNYLSVFDIESKEKIDEIPIPAPVWDAYVSEMIYDEVSDNLYVMCPWVETVYVINLATKNVVATLTGGFFNVFGNDSSNRLIYILDSQGGSYVIDMDSLELTTNPFDPIGNTENTLPISIHYDSQLDGFFIGDTRNFTVNQGLRFVSKQTNDITVIFGENSVGSVAYDIENRIIYFYSNSYKFYKVSFDDFSTLEEIYSDDDAQGMDRILLFNPKDGNLYYPTYGDWPNDSDSTIIKLSPDGVATKTGYIINDMGSDVGKLYLHEPSGKMYCSADRYTGDNDPTANVAEMCPWDQSEVPVEEPPEEDPVDEAFQILVKTDNGGQSEDNEFTIGGAEGTYQVEYDGKTEEMNGQQTLQFAEPGTHVVRITGLERIRMTSFGDTGKLLEVQNWGTTPWTSMQEAFWNCANLDVTATDAPNLSICTDMSMMFYFCTNLIGNSSLGQWDVSNVATLRYTFSECLNFNQDINDWDVSSVVNMDGTFMWAEAFNQPLGDWNPLNCQDFNGMFMGAPFNHPINNWNVSSALTMADMFFANTVFNQDLNSWDVSNVATMKGMFHNSIVFNGDVSSWNVSNATNMRDMFNNARVFNQDITSWNVSNVTNFQNMFNGALVFDQLLFNWILDHTASPLMNSMFSNSGMSVANYSNTVIGFSNNANANDGPKDVSFAGQNGMQYNASGATARDNLITNHNWNISGDSPA